MTRWAPGARGPTTLDPYLPPRERHGLRIPNLYTAPTANGTSPKGAKKDSQGLLEGLYEAVIVDKLFA